MSAESFVQKFIKNEDGVTAIEYAIVATGVAAVVMIVFDSDGLVATTLTNVFTTLSMKLTAAING